MRYHYPLEARLMRKFGRTAIWNKNKVIIVIAMVIWVTDVSFFIYSKKFLLTME